MRRVFTVSAVVLTAAVVVQFFLAGTGAIQTGPRDQAFAAHEIFGYVILLLAIAVTVLAAVAKLGRRVVGLAGLTIALVALQAVIAMITDAIGHSSSVATTAGRLVFGLHAVNALVIMMLTVNLIRAGRSTATPAEAELPTYEHEA